jgi:ribosome biogenesis GTPase / thiamine phosphate phosphatase
MEGLVLFGINNIYTVLSGGKNYLCRIKGKVLIDEMDQYNPIAVGDYVEITWDPHSDDVGWITGRGKRRNSIVRYNKKKRAPQVLAANVDQIACVMSVQSPPFRPRFLDRLIITGEMAEVAVIVVVNKWDLGMEDEEPDTERIAYYEKIGYRVVKTSVVDKTGLDEMAGLIDGKITVFIGHSGVGKSSLLNVLEPGLDLKVGELSSKYDRGVHTTRFAVMIRREAGGWLIDTPGIRELEIFDMAPDQLRFYFPDIMALSNQCQYTTCLHLDEPDCRVRRAVEDGEIHPDRYTGYLTLMDELKAAETANYRTRRKASLGSPQDEPTRE